MRNRNPFVVVLLTIITFGIYGIVWEVKTKNDMNKLGASIPTAWLIIIPFVSIWWLWKYSEGVEHVTAGKTSAILAFVLLFLLGVIGMAIVQYEFNEVGDQPTLNPAEPFGQPAPGFGAPVSQDAVSVTPTPPQPSAQAATFEPPTQNQVPQDQLPPANDQSQPPLA